MKRYGQRCSLARALDIVGERWSLLVVRELTLGPRRYSDLLDGLPGIPTNLLATRLKDLQAAGVITRHTLPPPTAVTVYELTEAGHALRAALGELRAWGSRYGAKPSDVDTVRPSWALLSAAGRPTTLPAGLTGELRVDGEFFHLSADGSGLVVRGGPAHRADATITLPSETLYRLLVGRTSAATAAQQSTVDGRPEVAARVLESLHGAVDDARPATGR